MYRLPSELYLSILILNKWEDEDIVHEALLLSLEGLVSPFGSKSAPVSEDDFLELLDFLREQTPVRKRGVSKQIRDWGASRNLDEKLFARKSARVKKARRIRFHTEIAHAVQLCLINPTITWEQVESKLRQLGTPVGLDMDIIKDYHRLFWSFDHIPVAQRKLFLSKIGATPATYAALDGRLDIAWELEYGIPTNMDDLARLDFMLETAHRSYCNGLYGNGKPLSGREIKAYAEAAVGLMQERRVLMPEEHRAEINFAAGKLPQIPTIDLVKENEDRAEIVDGELLLEYEEEEPDPSDKIIPLNVKNQKN